MQGIDFRSSYFSFLSKTIFGEKKLAKEEGMIS